MFKKIVNLIPLGRNSLTIVGMFVILLAIPLTVFLAQQQQELRQRAEPTTVPGFATMPGGNAGEGCSVDQWAIIPANPGPGETFQISVKKGQSNRGWRAGGFAQMWAQGRSSMACHFAETNNTQTANIQAPNSPGTYNIEYRVDNIDCGGDDEDDNPADTCDRKTITVQAGGGNSGPGECTVRWQLSNDTPSPNTDITVTVEGLKSATSGWSGIKLLMDSQAAGNLQRIDDSAIKPKFIYTVNSGAAGQHTLGFAVRDGQVNCQLPKTFTTGPGGGTPTPDPGNATLEINVKMQQVTNPRNNSRQVRVEIFDTNNNSVKSENVSAVFQNGKFTGTLNLGTFTTGVYVVKLKVGNTLRRLVENLTNITAGQANTLREVELFSGDIIADNELNALDYSNLIGCLDRNRGTPRYSCQNSGLADFNDDGSVDLADLNILVFNFSHRKGD